MGRLPVSNITIMSYDLNTTMKTLCGHTSWVYALKMLPDGRLASGSYDRTIRIWNLTTGTQNMVLYGHTAAVISLDVLANGYLVSISDDLTARIWNTTSGSLVRNITFTTYFHILRTINANYFAIGGYNGFFRVIE